jgi:hypothetical protein
MVVAGEQQPFHVLRVAASQPDAAGIAVHQLAAVLTCFVDRVDAGETDHRRQGVDRARFLRPAQRQPHQLDGTEHQQDDLRALAPFFVLHHGWARAGRALHRPVRGHAGADRENRRQRRRDEQRRCGRAGKRRLAEQRNEAEPDTHDDENDREVHDFRVQCSHSM